MIIIKKAKSVQELIADEKEKSIALIQRLGLNTFSEMHFTEFDEAAIVAYFKSVPYDSFSLRDRSMALSKIGAAFLSRGQVLLRAAGQKNFSIMGYMADWCNKSILCGEIMLATPPICNGYGSEYNDLILHLTASDKPNSDIRSAVSNPTVPPINGSLMDKKIRNLANRVQGLHGTIDYMCEHKLFNTVMEFATYSEPVGIKHENIAVFELRSNY